MVEFWGGMWKPKGPIAEKKSHKCTVLCNRRDKFLTSIINYNLKMHKSTPESLSQNCTGNFVQPNHWILTHLCDWDAVPRDFGMYQKCPPDWHITLTSPSSNAESGKSTDSLRLFDNGNESHRHISYSRFIWQNKKFLPQRVPCWCHHSYYSCHCLCCW